MKLKLRPILKEMLAFYRNISMSERFNTYIEKLQCSTKGDLILPIGGFNPMAKEHVLEKLAELEDLRVEEVMLNAISNFNRKNETKTSKEIQVLFNLADDLKGGWTNRYAADFDSKFKINALVSRGFCTPYLWSSENYNTELIYSRTMAYAYRTKYWMEHERLKSLEDFLQQEAYVFKNTSAKQRHLLDGDFQEVEAFFMSNRSSEDYPLIFNFFYGDEASESLGYPLYGNSTRKGFEYAEHLALETER